MTTMMGAMPDSPRKGIMNGHLAMVNSAMARDVIALIEHLHLDAVDVIDFSMGAGVAARVLMLGPPQVKSAILAGVGDYLIEETVMEFPKSWPVPDYVPRPITARVWAEEGAKILEQGEIVPGHLASANLIGLGSREPIRR